MDLNVGDQLKDVILNLCPILGTVNWKRRVKDDGPHNPYVQTLFRAAISLVVAAVIGIASGMLSAYIILQKLEYQNQQQDSRIHYLEDRMNNHLDGINRLK